jgi:ABC-type lipoprotein release transport system permease subunit
MIKKYELFLALNYLRRKKTYFILGISLISCIVIAEDIILSFSNLVKLKTNKLINPHICIYYPISLSRYPEKLTDLINKIKGLNIREEFSCIYKLINTQLLLRRLNKRRIVNVYGIDEEISNIHKDQALISADIAKNLNIKVGDSILLTSPYYYSQGILLRTQVEKIFNNQERNCVFVNFNLLNSVISQTPQHLAQSIIGIKLKYPHKTEKIKTHLLNNLNLGTDYTIKTFTDFNNPNLAFKLLLSVIVFITGAFSIISFMYNIKRNNWIKILRLLGLGLRNIKNILFIQGLVMIVIGGIIGLLIVYILNLF